MPDKISFSEVRSEKNDVFSILIPSWNNLEYLKLCIKSIEKNSHFQHQIIVLVNEGIDGTLEWVKSQKRINWVHASENIGICYGLNICRKLIKTSYILYLNDDMYVLPEWDFHLMEKVNEIGHNKFMLSSTMIEPDPSGNNCVIVEDYGRNPSEFKEEKLLQNFKNTLKQNWSGSTWPPNLIPIALWDYVGGMSTEFSPGMYSDPDFSMKLWQAGIRHFEGIGNSRVYHFGSKSTGRIKKNKGKIMFMKKWGISPSTFTRKYLKRGEPFTGEMENYTPGFRERIKVKLKLL